MARAEPLAITLDDKLAIVQLSDSDKPLLVRLRQRKRRLLGVLQTGMPEPAVSNSVPVLPDEILSVFPHKEPRFGKAYGVHIEPLYLSERLDHFGLLYSYRALSIAEAENLRKGFRLTYRRFIKPNNLQYLLPMRLELRNQQGKRVGYYTKPKKDEDGFITLSPDSFIGNSEISGPEYIMRILVHELTHPLQDLYLPDKIKARWIKLYHAFNRITELTTNDLQQLRADLVASKLSLTKFRKELDEDNRLPFDAVITWIRKVQHLDNRALNLLLSEADDLTDYWPHNKLHLSQLKIPVTDYASKNPEELCCESMAVFVLQPRNLLRPIRRLVQRTLRAVQPK